MCQYKNYVFDEKLVSPVNEYSCRRITKQNIKNFGFDSIEMLLQKYPDFPLRCKNTVIQHQASMKAVGKILSERSNMIRKPMKKCLRCQIDFQGESNRKFCSRSCAAKTNNLGVRRHRKKTSLCKHCGNATLSYMRVFCSNKCAGLTRIKSDEHKRKMNALRQHRWRAKGYRALAEDADPQKIKEFYLNCPPGHEVDHIHPLSLGGKHHEDNLQYLPWRINRSKSNHYIG